MNLSAKILQEAAKDGFRRLRNFRASRLMFIKAYVGQYFDRDHGEIGSEPLNMAFTAVRALVPNLVTRRPKAVVGTDYLMYRQYGELMALALDYMSKKLDLPEILQRGIVDAIFTMGIFKVGLKTSDSLIYFGEEAVDPGQVYVGTVDLDDFTLDPSARQLTSATFLGERIRVERDEILESGLYDNDVVEKLPSSIDKEMDQRRNVRNLSSGQLSRRSTNKLHDYIDLMELWLPGPNVLITLPYKSSTGGKFLREETYNGPDGGPYTFLTVTPPVPDNPMPVSLAGIWHDLHMIGNRLTKKTMNQAEMQKNVLGYRRSAADDAQEIVDARDGDAIVMDDRRPLSHKQF